MVLSLVQGGLLSKHCTQELITCSARLAIIEERGGTNLQAHVTYT